MSNTEQTPTQIERPDLPVLKIVPAEEYAELGKVLEFPILPDENTTTESDGTPPEGTRRPKKVLDDIDDDFSRNIEVIATENVDSDHPVIQRHREIEIKEREDDLNQMKPRLAGREPGEYKAAKLALKALNEADMDRSSEDAFNKGLVDILGSPPDDKKLREL